MAARSRTRGTPEYKRRQQRIARRRSTKPVGASLDPQTMADYIREFYDEDERRQQAQDTLQDVTLADPIERQRIAAEYARSKSGRVQSLAERGLSARGYSGNDLYDLERTRVLALDAQNLKLRTAQSQFESTIQRLNNRRTALDKQYAVMAGQNIQAGTGVYAGQKPAGWQPPSLQGTTTGTAAAAPTTPQQPGQVSTGVQPAPARPTGGRPSTTAPRKNRLTDPAYLRQQARRAGARGGFTRRVRVG